MKLYVLVLLFLYLCLCINQSPPQENAYPASEITLPSPRYISNTSVEHAIRFRRSIRDYTNTPLSLDQVSQLLWAGQGITQGIKRAAPSAGATYPLILYLVVGEHGVPELSPGIYQYIPKSHSLALVKEGDYKEKIASACLDQTFIQTAPVIIVIAAEYERTTARYGERGIRYVHMEAGHVGENIYLQAIALELGTVAVGAFLDVDLAQVLRLPEEQDPIYVMPVGYPN
jgi:SagB-type dehydrogenase family enzyme